MALEKTVRVKMLGNYDKYEVGKEYDVPIEKANQLTGIGFAVIVAAEAPAVKE